MTSRLLLEYDGTAFVGWAKQPGQRTVQEELERALSTILRCEIAVVVAGRTDTGVHAAGQVASYQHEAVDPQALNGLLPPDVAVLSCEPVPPGFDARRDATSRAYCYRVLARRARSALEAGRALWWPHYVDFGALEACGHALEGVHNFTAFTPTETDHVRFEREVFGATWVRSERDVLEAGGVRGEGDVLEAGGVRGERDVLEACGVRGERDVLEFWIEADAFMRQMNRVLVGTMLEVAAGRRSLESFAALLGGRPRSEAGPTAPAHGLYLAGVGYGAERVLQD